MRRIFKIFPVKRRVLIVIGRTADKPNLVFLGQIIISKLSVNASKRKSSIFCKITSRISIKLANIVIWILFPGIFLERLSILNYFREFIKLLLSGIFKIGVIVPNFIIKLPKNSFIKRHIKRSNEPLLLKKFIQIVDIKRRIRFFNHRN